MGATTTHEQYSKYALSEDISRTQSKINYLPTSDGDNGDTWGFFDDEM